MVTICRHTLTMRFFCESRTLLQARVRCIMSWSMPVVATTVNRPPTSCFQKNCGWFTSSK